MSDAPAQYADPAVRASDAEREQAVALLQYGFADGRLTQAELEERAGAAYAARTRAQLRELTADLPRAGQQPPRPGMNLDLCLLIILLCACPPAGMAYWLLSLRETGSLRAWLMNAPPWQRLLAGAIVAGAGAALEVFSHLAGAILVSAGVIVALPAISGPLHRAWVIVHRAFPVRRSQRPLAEQPGPHPGDRAGDPGHDVKSGVADLADSVRPLGSSHSSCRPRTVRSRK